MHESNHYEIGSHIYNILMLGHCHVCVFVEVGGQLEVYLLQTDA